MSGDLDLVVLYQYQIFEQCFCYYLLGGATKVNHSFEILRLEVFMLINQLQNTIIKKFDEYRL